MRSFEHAYHIDVLLCCEVCDFHSTKDNFEEILQDGFIFKQEWILCPNKHRIVKRCCELCMDLGDVTSYKAFYRDRNAIKCGACEYPVKVYKTHQLEEDEILAEDELEVIRCGQCGESGAESQLVVPLDDLGNCVGTSCVKCYSTQIVYNESLGDPPEEELEKIKNCSRATKTEVINMGNIRNIEPGDHIECSTHKYVLLAVDHHMFVSFVDLEQEFLIAFERLADGVRENIYYFKDLLGSYSICRRYVYEVSNSFEESIKMALTVVNKGGYNLFTKNCESFVRWLKTGMHESLQVKKAPGRILARLVSVFSKVPLLALASGVARNATRGAFGAVGGFGIASLVCAAMFAHDRYSLKKQLKAGEITREDYEYRVTEKAFENAGAVIGGGLGTVACIGMGVFGVGAFCSVGGAIIAGILGSLIFANLGSWLGKKLVNQRHGKRRRNLLKN